jgi:ATP-binding cassette subfamily B multidrug efflux pump
MTLFALIPVAIAIFVAFLMRKAIFKASALSRKANSDMSYATYDLFDNALTYRIYGRDQDNAGVYDRKLSDYEKKTVRSSALTDTMIPIANMIALAGIIPILLLGPTYVTEQAPLFAPIPNLMNPVWTLGQFSTYLTTFVLLASKASHTARLFGSIESGLASWKRIKPYIVPYQEYKTPVEVKGDDSLVFRDFGVEIEDKTLFSGLNLTARKNQIIGITGPIASGKSALGKTFLHDLPYVGSAVLFGKDLDQYAPEEIAGTIVYMGHQSELVTETIEENIALGEKKDVLPYLEAVSFTEDLKNMPEREKTIVGNEGVKLSGGQQERIALARTLYHRKSLVILDDPFASVDPKTEKEILAHLRSELSDSIVLLISHRLTSFSGLDEIIVINGDGTVSVGTEKELLSGNRTYQSLYSLQQNAGEVSHE